MTGKFSALDASGEWFRDPTAKTLYLWTPAGDSPRRHVVEAKARTYGFELSGRSFITIRGIHFFACSINTSSTSTHDTLNGIQALYVSHFERTAPKDGNLWLLHMEDTGIIIRGSNNILENSEIGFSAGNGVLLQGTNTSFSTGNVVTNNVIHDVDYAAVDCAGINAGAWWWNAATSTFNTISYNTIYNSGRDLIVFRNIASGLIVHNRLYNAGLQTDDGGALYTYSQNGKAFNKSSNPATVIAYNHICNDLTAYVNQSSFSCLFVVGIYLDDKSTNYVVHHNLVYGMSDAIFLNAGSPNNLVCNNTLLGLGTNSLVRIASLEARGDLTGTLFANNIYGVRTSIAGTNFHASNNLDLYAKPVDPKFIDPAALDYRLQSRSPAVNAGKVIPGYTDGYVGAAPDIGAFPCGKPAWTAGASAATNAYIGAVPAPPTHLAAAANGSVITLTWRASGSNETGCLVECSADGVGYRPVVRLPARTTSYADSAGIHYCYRVCAVNGQYQSAYSNVALSNEVGAATLIQADNYTATGGARGGVYHTLVVPPYPVGGCDLGDWVKYSNVYFDAALNKITVTYSSAESAGNHIEFRLDSPTGPIIGYITTQRSRKANDWNEVFTDSATVRGVTSGVHDLYITFGNQSGGGGWGICGLYWFQFSDTAGLRAPTGLVATRASDRVVNLRWTDNSKNTAGFKIERSTDNQTFVQIGTVGANVTTCQDTSGSSNTRHYYRVRAFNQSSGNSVYSNIAASQTRSKAAVPE